MKVVLSLVLCLLITAQAMEKLGESDNPGDHHRLPKECFNNYSANTPPLNCTIVLQEESVDHSKGDGRD
ncbi:hypothetical protein KFK09_020243 [Dendrobium nobile]|uniref:Uncharacterized protein n=1 Tax=Dendrobium nobile TaxID=94219 RepID=A0A8T3AT90_DENNO|nr:hypothetical protein KFK09_020243 [Dendrobium nobile]